MALIAVLWIVAALSVIVASVSQSARQEVRAVSHARQAVQGQALGIAAIQMVLQEMATSSTRSQALEYKMVRFKETDIRVQVMPLTGLIDINNAPVALLSELFVRKASMEPRSAAALADAVVQVRSAQDARRRAIGFEAPEDLLRVPGLDYTLYAKISGLITADVKGSGRVNPQAAPPGVLDVLAGRDAAPVRDAAAGRGAGMPGADTTTLNADFIESNPYAQRFRLEARVPLADGAWLLVSRTVDLSGGDNGLQWRVIHGDARFEPLGGERL